MKYAWIIFIFLTTVSSCRPPISQTCHTFYPSPILCEIECFSQNIMEHYITIKAQNDIVKFLCHDPKFNYTLLEGANLGPVENFSLEYCSLPEVPLNAFFSQFGIFNVKRLLLKTPEKLRFNESFFQNLTNITHLLIANNEITEFPTSFSKKMVNLISLDLSYNNLSFTGNEFMYLPKLKKLELGSNHIKVLKPGMFLNLSSLEFLNLWGNRIDNLNKQNFTGLKNLNSLDLSANSISFLSSNTFEDMKNLTILSLRDNNLTHLPRNLFTSTKRLRVIKLFQNNRLNGLPHGIFANLTFLQEVHIGSCNISVIPRDTFWHSFKIISIDLSHNSLSSLPHLLFRDTFNLQYLDISHNGITTLPSTIFSSLNKLLTLQMKYNKLQQIDEQLFYNLHRLQKLDINNNLLEKIHENSFFLLKSLKEVNLSHNKLSFKTTYGDIFGMWSPLQYCHSLEILDLSHNNIQEIFTDWITTLQNLKKLDLSFNKIKYIEAADLQFSYTQPVHVNLEHNNISSIILFGLEAISSEIVSNNIDEVIPTYVRLGNNPLSCECHIYQVLRYLENKMKPSVYQMVNLHLNNLVCVHPSNYAGIPIMNISSETFLCRAITPSIQCPSQCKCDIIPHRNVLKINCTGAGFKNVPKDLLNSTYNLTLPVEIILDNNNITSLSEMLPVHPKIVKLSMSYNHLASLDNVQLPPNLKELRIDHNNLTYLNFSTLEILPSDLNLALHNNPWNCDCEENSIALLQFVKANFQKLEYLNNITCTNGQPLINLVRENICVFVGIYSIICFVLIVLSLSIGLVMGFFVYKRDIRNYSQSANILSKPKRSSNVNDPDLQPVHAVQSV